MVFAYSALFTFKGLTMTIEIIDLPADITFSHAVLDFDGVVADTEGVFAVFDCALFNEVLKLVGQVPDLAPSYVRTLAGNGAERKLELVAERRGFDPAPFLDEYLANRTKARKTLFQDHPVPLAQGLDEFTEAMAGRFGVATNKNSEKLLPDMKIMGLDGRFPVIVPCDPPLRKKPQPDVIVTALEKLGADPDSSIYVGDNVLDMEAALAAGVTPIGFVIEGLEGHEERAEALKAAGAIVITDDFRDLLPLFDLAQAA